MPETTVRIDSDVLTSLVHKAIVDTLTDEDRQAVVTAAVQQLMRPTDGYGRKLDSPLQNALSAAVSESCRVIADEMVKENVDLQQQIRDMVLTSMVSVLNNEESKLRQSVTEAVANSLARTRWDD